jgi:hypothetical protein
MEPTRVSYLTGLTETEEQAAIQWLEVTAASATSESEQATKDRSKVSGAGRLAPHNQRE